MTRLLPNLVLLVLLPAASLAAQVQEIQPGATYPAGTRVGAASLGVSFVIPDGWVGTLPQGAEVFVMGSNDRPGMILVSGAPVGSLQEAIGLLSEPLPIDNFNVLRPVGAPVVEGGELTQTYRAVIQGQEFTGEAHGFVSPQGVGLVYVAMGPLAQAAEYRRLASGLAASTELTTPVAAPGAAGGSDGEWDAMIRGYKLHYISSSDGYNNEEQIDLCQNGRFARSGEGGASSAIVSGAWVSSAEGSWSVSGGHLNLRLRDGQTESYELSLDGTKLLLNGYRYFRVGTDRCR